MKRLPLLIFLLISHLYILAQENNGSISGNFENNLQTYTDDESIGATAADEILLNNAYLNILYKKGKFSSGFRYESYLNALMDYDSEYQGNGIPYRFASYISEGLDITVGNYYEQFGSGIVFRTYEDKGLGIDNAMDGVRLKYSPINGIYLKSFIGKSRTYFEYSEGIMRGADIELNLNESLNINGDAYYILGANIVSRFQQDNNPKFTLPENVAAMSARLNIIKGNINYYGEYAYKINDPIGSFSLESNNYAPGRAIVNNFSYSEKAFGITVESHWVDHMEFRSERAKEKEFIINYIPTLSKQHTYTLLALYPSSTQAEGEFGVQSDIFYRFKKGSLLGGKYGTKINLNFSKINGIQNGASFINDSINITSPILRFDKDLLYFSDFNLEINKKINKQIKINLIVAKQKYNKDILEGKTIGEYGIISSTIAVADVSYKLKKGHTLRLELQGLLSKQEEEATQYAEGDWSMMLVEYTISPNWFFAFQDMYNWGNHYEDQRLHYMNASIGYIKGTNRFEIGYGKKRAGIFCVGGICKEVPASNGFNLNISSSF
tara:strand:+ start:1395 stop:3047 length:1653 start_codon:yes stop_codon:yes gene_type:complete